MRIKKAQCPGGFEYFTTENKFDFQLKWTCKLDRPFNLLATFVKGRTTLEIFTEKSAISFL